MVNAYHLFLKTPNAKKENLYRLWEKHSKQDLDKTQRRWIEMCMKGERKMNIISRHGKHHISQQQMMKPQQDFQSKGLTHTLDELPKGEYTSMQKSLQG